MGHRSIPTNPGVRTQQLNMKPTFNTPSIATSATMSSREFFITSSIFKELPEENCYKSKAPFTSSGLSVNLCQAASMCLISLRYARLKMLSFLNQSFSSRTTNTAGSLFQTLVQSVNQIKLNISKQQKNKHTNVRQK